ncbi:MAG TPA: cytochrome C oxidase subunit IV family protein [Bryobacteraceae bacterium]|nr:cytochrome C oxidase subunit IV family protein [Bryobacteraceae bacterium]
MSNHAATHEHEITGPKTYSAILAALLVLTIITVAVSRVDFGSMNTVVALLIASIKGSLVALFFMHLRHDKFNAVIFVLGLFFLAVFLIWTLFDISTRVTVLPANLKQPVQAFPGAPLNKPIRPSTGQPTGQQPTP